MMEEPIPAQGPANLIISLRLPRRQTVAVSFVVVCPALSCGSSVVDGFEVDVERQPGRVPEEAVAPVQALSL